MKAIGSRMALVVALFCIMAYGVHSQNASSPSLGIRILPDQNIEISWPAAASGFRIETTEQLESGGLWAAVSQPIVSTNGLFMLTVPPDAFSRYYRLRLQSSVVLPPEPATVAPPVVETAAADIASSTAFLYTGETPIQTGVASGVIVPRQAVVIRGLVQNADGKPLAGAKIQIQDHPEYGQTLSRADGRFDLAANGGSTVYVNYQADGYLSAQRTVNVPWQDFVETPAVTLLGSDSVQTVLKTGEGSTTQIAMGGVVSDASGTRKAAVILPAGVTASIITASGQTQAVSTLTTRFTEYTVGTNGPSAMPGLLPPTVGYTYAVELGTAEAQAKVAGKDVIFDKPVYFYVDNFLGMPAGIIVPMGYYDKTKAAWIPSPNGRVIQLKGVNSQGLAEVDADGDGAADTAEALAGIGMDDAERRTLANTYAPTQSLWRVPISHFSTYDCNYGTVLAPGAEDPSTPMVYNSNVQDAQESGGQGIVETENQVFREFIPVTGVPFALHYSSRRAPGYLSTLDIPISGENIPAPLKRIDVEIQVAGRVFTHSYAPATNLHHLFKWDGMDAYGRKLPGTQTATIRLGYAYDSYYALPASMAASFGSVTGKRIPGNIKARMDTILWRENKVDMGQSASSTADFAGWTLSIQHAYDFTSKTLEMGTGTSRNAKDLQIENIITTVAGNGKSDYHGNGKLAVEAPLSFPCDVEIGPDGSIYIAEGNARQVSRVKPDGKIYIVAGSNKIGFSGDGGPATNAALGQIKSIALGKDGSIYIADRENNRIRKVTPDGLINTVAGSGPTGMGKGGFSGDGGPATNALLSMPCSVAVAADGTFYFLDERNYRVRKVGPDGVISTIAGNGSTQSTDKTALATEAAVNANDICLAADGSIYVTDYRIRRIGVDGMISMLAYNDPPENDENAGASKGKGFPTCLTIAPDGSIIFSDASYNCIRRRGNDGVVTTLAGVPKVLDYGQTQFAGDNGPARNGLMTYPSGVAFGPDGYLYIADSSNNRIRRVGPALPEFGIGNVLVASEDGSQVYQFDSNGRHLRTMHALTGGTLFEFGYENGHLVRIADGTGQTTRIERDAFGAPLAIVSPQGQRTVLGIDKQGCLASVSDPAGHAVQCSYGGDGLLAGISGPLGHEYRMSYDVEGRLIRAGDPDGGYMALTRETFENGFNVRSASAMNRTNAVQVEEFGASGQRRTFTNADGSQSLITRKSDGTLVGELANGSIASSQSGPDPRFGMQSPVRKSRIITLPSGLSLTNTTELSARLANATEPMSMISLTNRSSINGQWGSTVYTASNRVLSFLSAGGRSNSVVLNEQGRVVRRDAPGVESVFSEFDGKGRLVRMSAGSVTNSRTTLYGYDTNGYPAYTVNALGETNFFKYNNIGQLESKRFPDGREAFFTYDAEGNVLSVRPPGRPAHEFSYNAVDLIESYRPPSINGETNPIRHVYNKQRQKVAQINPDGRGVTNLFDDGGRLAATVSQKETNAFEYSYNGMVVSSSTSDGIALQYEYDGHLLTQETWQGTIEGAVHRSYNNDFRISSWRIGDLPAITNGFDKDGALVRAGNFVVQRDPATGMLTNTTTGDVSVRLAWTRFAELAQNAANFHGTNLLSFEYHRDAIGRLDEIKQIQGVSTNLIRYAYNSSGRLASVESNGTVAVRYEYDLNGNRLVEDLGTMRIDSTYDDRDRLLRSRISRNGTVADDVQYSWDAIGNLTNQSSAAGTKSFQYDTASNLKSALLADGRRIEYLYDGRHRRVGKKMNGSMTGGFLYYDTLRPAAELDASSHVMSQFVYGSSDNVPDYMIRGGEEYRLITDHLGSVRMVVNTRTGDVAQRLDYDPFGRVTLDTHPGFQPFGYAGGIYDPDTGWVRFGARDYDPETGRWTTRDPVLFAGGSLNHYAYALNDPINLHDPLGFGPNWKKFKTGLWQLGTGTLAGVGLLYVEGLSVGVATPAVVVGGTYSAYSIGSGIGNMYNAFANPDAPEAAGGPLETIGQATGSSKLQKAGSALDLAPGLISGGSDPVSSGQKAVKITNDLVTLYGLGDTTVQSLDTIVPLSGDGSGSSSYPTYIPPDGLNYGESVVSPGGSPVVN